MMLMEAVRSVGGSLSESGPGRWQVCLHERVPAVEVRVEDGWTTLVSELGLRLSPDPASEPWYYLYDQAPYPNLKFCGNTHASPDHRLKLRTELPVDASGSDDQDAAWLTETLIRFSCVLLTKLPTQLSMSLPSGSQSSTRSPARPEPDASDPALKRTATTHIEDIVTDLGFTCEAADEGSLTVEVASRNQIRRVIVQKQADAWRVALPIGTGDVLTLDEPMKRAVGRFLIACSTELRFVRPYARAFHVSGSEDANTIGFETHLPLRPKRDHMKHALAALITATQHFETEIENLATEAILSHAYLSLTGGSAANQQP